MVHVNYKITERLLPFSGVAMICINNRISNSRTETLKYFSVLVGL